MACDQAATARELTRYQQCKRQSGLHHYLQGGVAESRASVVPMALGAWELCMPINCHARHQQSCVPNSHNARCSQSSNDATSHPTMVIRPPPRRADDQPSNHLTGHTSRPATKEPHEGISPPSMDVLGRTVDA
jgi:hypothetical protein